MDLEKMVGGAVMGPHFVFRICLLLLFLPPAPLLAQQAAPKAAPAKDEAPAKPKYQSLTTLEDGAIRDWLVLTGIPFDLNPQAVQTHGDFMAGESEFRPREGYTLRNDRLASTKVFRWKKCASDRGTLDFAQLGAEPQTMNYAVAYLVAPRAISLRTQIGGDVSRAWLNGKPLTRYDQLDLTEGLNVVVFRVANAKGERKFTLRISNQDPKALAELQTTLNPDDEEDARSRSLLEPDPAFVLFPKPGQRISYVSEESRAQVQKLSKKAITFLLENQQANGAWSDTNYPDSVGVTALCCLALMAEGNLPNQGPHGKSLDKGLEFLLASFKDEGVCSSGKVEGYGVMYGHALATLALLEVNGNMPWRPELEDRISKALQVIFRYQRLDGGWRYDLTKTGESDISVTTTVLWVLGQARRYGYTVPHETMDKALKFVEACGQSDGMFMYRLSGRTKVMPHSGVGVAALYGAGRIDHPLLPKARELIVREYQRYSVEDLSARPYLLFGSFFAGLAMYSSGYEMWQPWYAKMVEIVAHGQGKEGDIRDQAGNKVYTTALAAIILQAPNGYLSIFVQ